MEYPYTNQEKVKSRLAKGDFIMFREKVGEGQFSAVMSGIVRCLNGKIITVEAEDNAGKPDRSQWNLDDLILYRDIEWDDEEGYTIQAICKEGICPLCGGELIYGERDDVDNGGTQQWECDECGATGEEGFDRVFDGNHYCVQDANGVPVEIAASAPVAVTKEMSCTYLAYQELMDKLYLGVGLTDSHLNYATETIRLSITISLSLMVTPAGANSAKR